MKATDLKLVVIGLALLLPAGCAQYYERVVLLPSADGGPGAVTFATRGEKSKAELSRPYDVLEIGYDTVKPGTTTEAEVRQRYGKIVPVSPPPPEKSRENFCRTSACRAIRCAARAAWSLVKSR